MDTLNPREAAFLAVWLSLKENNYVSDLLEKWRAISLPASIDFNLAKEIACGAIRMTMSIDYIAGCLSNKQKLNLKLKEKALLRCAIYQFFYMDRIPSYAIVDETIKIAKKYCHQSFVGFLNAILRKISVEKPLLPNGQTIQDLSIRYSYPVYYIQELTRDYGLEKTVEILTSSNISCPLMYRIRLKTMDDVELLSGTTQPIGILRSMDFLTTIAKSPNYYIQNVTPSELISILSKEKTPPKTVLDLCSSPGGKLIAIHDQFPEALLYANDVSYEKIKPLSENLDKYGIKAFISCFRGENFHSSEPFDLIILDVPCSNSGVLYKRPEARWRISQKNMEELEQLQMELIKKAVSLMSDDGEIWFMTCSILKRENEKLVENACKLFNLRIRTRVTILPNADGWDGGFACALARDV